MGFEGLGIWWSIFEIVAERVNKDNQFDRLTLTKGEWRALLGGIHHRKFNVFLSHCEDLQGSFKEDSPIRVEYDEEKLTIQIPNILKIADNYTKKLAQPSKQEVEGEIEGERETEGDIPFLPKGSKGGSTPSTQEAYAVMYCPDGPHDIFMDQIDEWDRMFPNVSVKMEVSNLSDWTKRMYERDSWTNKQRKEWKGSSVAMKVYTSLKYRQKENSGYHAPQQQAQQKANKKPATYYMMLPADREEWDKLNGYL